MIREAPHEIVGLLSRDSSPDGIGHDIGVKKVEVGGLIVAYVIRLSIAIVCRSPEGNILLSKEGVYVAPHRHSFVAIFQLLRDGGTAVVVGCAQAIQRISVTIPLHGRIMIDSRKPRTGVAPMLHLTLYDAFGRLCRCNF